MTQEKGESVRAFWTPILKKKNKIIDCDNVEAIVAFKHDLKDEHLTRDLRKTKPKTMAALMNMVTNFCFGEDVWHAKQKTREEPDTSAVKDEHDLSWCNRNRKCMDDDCDDELNAGFGVKRQAGGAVQRRSRGKARRVTTIWALMQSWIDHATIIGLEPRRPSS